MAATDHWKECIADTAQDLGIELTAEQIEQFADACEGVRENWCMYEYGPPPSGHTEVLERNHKQSVEKLNQSHNAEVKRLKERIEDLQYENRKLRDRIYDLQYS